jgi:16S rRNA (cytosine1402-N4)-methyltransferase
MKNTKPIEHGHTSVLLHESIDGLRLKAGDIVVDGTLGSGGHTEEIAKQFGKDIRIIGIDMDTDALARSKKRLKSVGARIDFVQSNFKDIATILDKLEIKAVNGILLDIGLSSNQLEESGRGFSFKTDEPLHMTFQKNPKEEDVTAKTVVNEWSEETLATIIKGFGEERFAKRIARAIVEYRQLEPIETTFQLVDVIGSGVPGKYRNNHKLHFATRTFQAIRIAVNQELIALEHGLVNGFERLAFGGRMSVISFHSLEDRIVKHFFRQKANEHEATLITKRPLTATEAELELNRRSRSAKLRIIEKK